MASDAAAVHNRRERGAGEGDIGNDAVDPPRDAHPPFLLVGVCMRQARWDDLRARGMVPGAGAGAGAAFEFVPFGALAARLASLDALPLDAILHKVTDDLEAGASPGGDASWWPQSARALAGCLEGEPPPLVLDGVASVMRVADRWATADALEAAGVATPASARVSATATAAEALAALAAAGVSLPVIVKPRLACGSAGAHALAVALGARGVGAALAAAGGGGCDALVQAYVDHGGVLWKVYVAGEAVHIERRASLPDAGAAAGGGGGGEGAAPTTAGAPDELPSQSWAAFDSGAPGAGAAALARTATRAPTARPPPDPPPGALDAFAGALRQALKLTLFGFDAVVEARTGEAAFCWGHGVGIDRFNLPPPCPHSNAPSPPRRRPAHHRRQLLPVDAGHARGRARGRGDRGGGGGARENNVASFALRVARAASDTRRLDCRRRPAIAPSPRRRRGRASAAVGRRRSRGRLPPPRARPRRKLAVVGLLEVKRGGELRRREKREGSWRGVRSAAALSPPAPLPTSCAGAPAESSAGSLNVTCTQYDWRSCASITSSPSMIAPALARSGRRMTHRS